MIHPPTVSESIDSLASADGVEDALKDLNTFYDFCVGHWTKHPEQAPVLDSLWNKAHDKDATPDERLETQFGQLQQLVDGARTKSGW